MKIIIIDDEAAHRELMERAIKKEFPDCQVYTFAEVEPCLKSLDPINPDVIITDYLLPGMDGLDFLKKVQEQGKDIPVVVVTGQGDEKIAVEAMRLGAYDYIVKSGDFFALVPSIVQRVIHRKRLKKALHESHALYRRERNKLNSILASIVNPLAAVRADMTVDFANPIFEQVFGKDFVGKPYQTVFHASHDASARCQKAIQDRQIEIVEFEDPEGRVWQVTVSPTMEHEEDAIAAILVFHDITEQKRAEEALSESEAKYKVMVEGTAEGILVADIETKQILYANPAACRMFGYDEWEFTRLNVTDINPKELLDRAIAGFEAKARMENVIAVDIPCLRKDGTVFHVDIHSTVIVLEGRRCNVSFFRDTTERRQIEEALRQSQERYRALVDNSLLGIAVMDTNYRIITVNAAFASLFRKLASDFVGKSCFREFEKREAVCAHCPGTRAMASGKTAEVETQGVRDDGSRFYVRNRAVPFFAPDGTVSGFIEIVEDIDKQRRAEQELRESEKRFQQVAESAQEWIWEVDAAGLYVYCSPVVEQILGYKSEETVGKKHFYDLFHPGDRSALKDAAFKAFARGERLVTFENRNVHKDGHDVWLSTSGMAILDNKGNLLGYRGVNSDITERKRADEEKHRLQTQFQQAQKMEAIGTLAGGIAHNFNNLLTGILGYASLVRSKTDPSHPNYKMLKKIEGQVQSGSMLAKQLLRYARKGKYAFEPLGLNQLVEETSETFGQMRRQIVIHQKLAEDLSLVSVDRGQMEQVLLNLFVNAADVMPHGGHLTLKTQNITHEDLKDKVQDPDPGQYAWLMVSDTGIGMDKEIVERIFDPFFTTKGVGKGTGLGLTSAYGIIKDHGGYIDVESEKGKGTTFNIYLPASEREIEQKIVQTSGEIFAGTGTVLVVDDEETNLEVCQKWLEAIGYRVLTAKDGGEATQIYKENRSGIDLVLLDMVMPDISGGETYDRLKEINPGVKVLLMSGYSFHDEAAELLRRGCNGFIQKPFEIEKLSRKTRDIIEGK